MHLKRLFIMTVSLLVLGTNFIYGQEYTLNGKKTNLSANRVYLNGVQFYSEEITPLNIDNRVYVAVQDLKGLVGAAVKWDKKAEEINISKDGNIIKMKKGNSFYRLNGKKVSFDKGTKVHIVDNRSMVPLSFAIREFSLSYKYDTNAKTLYLTSNGSGLFAEEDSHGTDGLDSTSKWINQNNSDEVKGMGLFSEEDGIDISEHYQDNVVVGDTSSADKHATENKSPSKNNEVKKNTFSLLREQSEMQDILMLQLSGTLKYTVETAGNVVSIHLPNMEITGNDYNKGGIIDKIDVQKTYDNNGSIVKVYYASSVNMNLLNIQKNNRSIVLQYNLPQIKPTAFSYKKDRSTATLNIPLTKSVKSISLQQTGKGIRFYIDKSAANLNPENITGSADDRLMSSIVITDEGNRYAVEMTLKERVSHNVISAVEGKNIIIELKKGNHRPPKIVIDPGHGGKDNGAVANGLKEKELNLQVTSKLVPRLRELGYDVITTRDDDTYPTLDERAQIANRNDADLFISVHHNSADKKTSIHGIETYYTTSQDSKKFADIVHREIISVTNANNRGVKTAKYLVTRKTYMPAVLLELGFMTNENEALNIGNPVYQQKISDAIVRATNEYFDK